jgi:hypothetical protein
MKKLISIILILIIPTLVFGYNTTFMEPGGDADFLVGTTNGFWFSASNAGSIIATDFVHGSHVKSLSFVAGATTHNVAKKFVLADSGTRISAYFYFVAFPSVTVSQILRSLDITGGLINFSLKVTSAGVLQLFETTNQIGSDGPTLSTGQWYRISIAYTITNTTNNRFEVFVNGVSAISVTNATITNVGSNFLQLGGLSGNTGLDFRSSDHYIDNSNSLTDTGNIWVTAKRPFTNGTANNFSTQIGVGGSGYGSGHSPQVNERPLSTTNGWSMVGAGSAVTEEYNIEGRTVGDIPVQTYDTIVDTEGWASMSSLVGETVQLIKNGVNYPKAITSSATMYFATTTSPSSTYPAGTGADIGMTTDTSLTTVSLYESGVLTAFIPGTAPPPHADVVIGKSNVVIGNSNVVIP